MASKHLFFVCIPVEDLLHHPLKDIVQKKLAHALANSETKSFKWNPQDIMETVSIMGDRRRVITFYLTVFCSLSEAEYKEAKKKLRE